MQLNKKCSLWLHISNRLSIYHGFMCIFFNCVRFLKAMTVNYSYVLVIIFSLKKGGEPCCINYWVKHIKHLVFIGILKDFTPAIRFSQRFGWKRFWGLWHHCHYHHPHRHCHFRHGNWMQALFCFIFTNPGIFSIPIFQMRKLRLW